MSLATWLLFLATDVALSLTPGPAVLFVVGTGLRRGLPAAIGANLGILFANTIYFVVSAFGLGVLLATAEPVFVALKWLGAAYLVWLAIGAFRAAAKTKAQAVRAESSAETFEHRDVFEEPPGKGSRRVSAEDSARTAFDATRPVGSGFGEAFRAAVLLQLGNPKAILFFTALLPQFVDPDGAFGVPAQIAILALTGCVAEFFVLLGYGWLAARAARATQDPKLLVAFERASGVCLLGCAALALAA